MYCKRCGKNLTDSAHFCGSCGTPVESGASGRPTAARTQRTSAKNKKRSPILIVLAASIGAIILCVVLLLAILGINRNTHTNNTYPGTAVMTSSSESGASFNCTFDDVIKRYNNYIDKHIYNDSGWTKEQFEDAKRMLKIQKSEFTPKKDGTYFYTKNHLQTNEELYGITVNTDDQGHVYCVEMVWKNALDDSTLSMVMVMLRGLIGSVETSKSEDEINQLIIDTDSSGGALIKDHVGYLATYESTVTRFSAIAISEDSNKNDQSGVGAQSSANTNMGENDTDDDIYAILFATPLVDGYSTSVGTALYAVFNGGCTVTITPQENGHTYVLKASGTYWPNPDVPQYSEKGEISYTVDVEKGTCSVRSDAYRIQDVMISYVVTKLG